MACIRTVSISRLRENIAEVCADSFIQAAYSRVRAEFLVSADAMGTDLLARVASVFMLKPYDYRARWPDSSKPAASRSSK